MKKNRKRMVIGVAVAVFILIGALLAQKCLTPRPVIWGENTQILSIDYFDAASGDRISMEEYDRAAILNILEDLSETWTLSKSDGIRYGADDVLLYMAVAHDNEVKSICFEQKNAYSTEGRGTHCYQIRNAEDGFQALQAELGLALTN